MEMRLLYASDVPAYHNRRKGHKRFYRRHRETFRNEPFLENPRSRDAPISEGNDDQGARASEPHREWYKIIRLFVFSSRGRPDTFQDCHIRQMHYPYHKEALGHVLRGKIQRFREEIGRA